MTLFYLVFFIEFLMKGDFDMLNKSAHMNYQVTLDVLKGILIM